MTAMRIGRLAWSAALAIVVAHVVLVWLARAPGVIGDEAVYIALARSLRSFHYQEIFYVGLPIHRMYPPGYPLLLAAASVVVGERFNALVVVSMLSSAAALIVLFATVTRRWGPFVGLTCLAGLAVNPLLVTFSGWVISEAPFILCAVIAVCVLARDDSRRSAVVAGGATIAAALVRSIGVSVVVGLVFYWLWKRRYRRASCLAVAAVLFVGGWLAFSALAPGQVPGRSYLADAALHTGGSGVLRTVLARVWAARVYGRYFYWQLAPAVGGTWLDDLVAVPVVVAGLAWGLRVLCARWPAALAFMVPYAAVLLVWPYTVERFLAPLVPFVIVTMVVGIDALAASIRPSLRRPALVIALAFLISAGAPATYQRVEARYACDRSTRFPGDGCLDRSGTGFFQAARYVSRHVPPDALFAAVGPAVLFYATGHQSVNVSSALAQSPPDFMQFLRDHHVSHILLAPVTAFSEGAPTGGTPLPEMVRANCRQLQLESSFAGDAYLFRVGPATERFDNGACQAAQDYVDRHGSTSN
jgi:hypothetical protein